MSTRGVASRVVLLLAAIVLGLATTLSVAFAIAAFGTPINPDHSDTVEIVDHPAKEGKWNWAGFMWDYGEGSAFGQTVARLMSLPFEQRPNYKIVPRLKIAPEIDWFFDRSWLPTPVERDQISLNHLFTVRLYGWPARCLWLGTVGNSAYPSRPAPWTDHGYGAIGAGYSAAGQRLLPARVLWPGLLIDTIAFTAAWIVVLVLGGQFAQNRRRRRGLCVQCKYDRKGLPPGAPCPECGYSPILATSTP